MPETRLVREVIPTSTPVALGELGMDGSGRAQVHDGTAPRTVYTDGFPQPVPTYEFGLIAARPDPATRLRGSTYFATDDGPGTLYQVNAVAAWQQVGSLSVPGGTEIAYQETSTPVNLTTANGIGQPVAFQDLPGMSMIVPPGQAFYLEIGFLSSWNTVGQTAAGVYGVIGRLVDINDAATTVVEAQASATINTAGGYSGQTATNVFAPRRIAALAAAVTYKMQGKMLVPGANVPAASGNYYLYGGSGYNPIFMRARAA